MLALSRLLASSHPDGPARGILPVSASVLSAPLLAVLIAPPGLAQGGPASSESVAELSSSLSSSGGASSTLTNQQILIGLNLPLQAGSVSTLARSLAGALKNVVTVLFLP